jgi:hypothetical protein
MRSKYKSHEGKQNNKKSQKRQAAQERKEKPKIEASKRN